MVLGKNNAWPNCGFRIQGIISEVLGIWIRIHYSEGTVQIWIRFLPFSRKVVEGTEIMLAK
jgi:hypothetical protein